MGSRHNIPNFFFRISLNICSRSLKKVSKSPISVLKFAGKRYSAFSFEDFPYHQSLRGISILLRFSS